MANNIMKYLESLQTQASIVDNVEKELMDMQKADPFEFAKTNLISVTMGNETEKSTLTEHCGKSPPRMTILFNAIPYHIRPLAINIISNVLYGDNLYRDFDDSSHIKLTNHPLVYDRRVEVDDSSTLFERNRQSLYTSC